MLAVAVIETRRHIARHFNVLDLVAPHGNLVGVEHQNIRAHQHGVHEQSGGYVHIRILPGSGVFIDRRFVGVGAVEHTFSGDAG